MKEIYFLSSNQHKIAEIKNILASENIVVTPVSQKIDEIQSNDMQAIARDKALKAYRRIARPVLVEQTGLLIKKFGDLPGGLTQIFWDSLQADKFSEFFSKDEAAEVIAKTVLAFCDGKRVHIFEGEISGNIVNPPRGDRAFQWDCVFQPKSYEKTFAEMGEEKSNISMRKVALEKLRKHLEEEK